MKRVHFIGSGFESVKSLYIKVDTNGEAIDKALQEYDVNGWTFPYNEIEVEPYDYKED